MKLSITAINFFEHLASNAHHQVNINELIEKQPSEFKKIYTSNNSENFRYHFSETSYLADTSKVTDI